MISGTLPIVVALLFAALCAADTELNVNRILDYFTHSQGKGLTYKRLQHVVDTFGPRLAGSQAHHLAVNWILQEMRQEGIDSAYTERIMVPHWSRGEESVTLLEPYKGKLQMIGLGGSIGGNITGEVIVVQSFDELAQVTEAQGKIILLNPQCDWISKPVECYGETAKYRENGADKAAAVGALAVLVRTIGSFSIGSPHTGVMIYSGNYEKIPAAAVSIEVAEMFQRLYDNDQKIRLNLFMSAKTLPERESHNLIGEVKGSTHPEQIILVSGHLDSWDVGQGAMDDGGGALISWSVISALNSLGIRPKRTIRFVGWGCEEFGGIGSSQYYEKHKDDAANYDLVMESDEGVFRPRGIQLTGSEATMEVFSELMKYLDVIGAGNLTGSGYGEDVDMWKADGVPVVSLLNENSKYFWFHHSDGDMLNVLNSDDIDLAAATWTIAAYLVADYDTMLPRLDQDVFIE